jgi:SAM-dependent methyltransferase
MVTRPSAPAAVEGAAAYELLGATYDRWCRSVTEDIGFYVNLALESGGGPVLEIGVGSGRIAVPVALAGVPVVGIDASPVMLELARRRVGSHAVDLTLIEADMRNPPDLGRFPLITIPFRALLHLRDDEERLALLRDLHGRLDEGGRLAFDVFHPDRIDIAWTHERWMEREPEIFERAVWSPNDRSVSLTVRSGASEATMELWWAEPKAWAGLLEKAGFGSIECYGWFDRRPLETDSSDSVWIAA